MEGKRLIRLREKMVDFGCDCVVLFSNTDIRYFMGIDVEGVLVVDREDQKLFVSKLYYQQAKDEINDMVVLSKGLHDLVSYLQKRKLRRIGFDFMRSSYSQISEFKGFEIVDFTNQTLVLRMIKEQSEINQIKRAAYIARDAFLKVYPDIKIGIAEKEIADELSCQLRKNGADKEAFGVIVASGANASYPHHVPTDKKIENGEFVVIDFGANIEGYNSDVTYTFLIGQKTDEKRELFNSVFYAQLYATEMIAPGRTTAKEIDLRAREELKKRGLDKYFVHSLGHGVGLDVHEFPLINSENDMLIQPNMVFTIEPGIYIPGKLGVRIEHMVLTKDNDIEIIAFTPFMEIM